MYQLLISQFWTTKNWKQHPNMIIHYETFQLYIGPYELLFRPIIMLIIFMFIPCIKLINIYHLFFFLWRCDPTRFMASSFLMFLDHTQRRITVGWTPLDEWSARRRDLYLTTHNTHNRQTSMPPVGFEPTISAGERPQTNALDRAANGTGFLSMYI